MSTTDAFFNKKSAGSSGSCRRRPLSGCIALVVGGKLGKLTTKPRIVICINNQTKITC